MVRRIRPLASAVSKNLKNPLAGLLLVLAVSAVHGQVVITEIMYHPPSDDDGDEFIELYNPGPGSVNLENWCFDGINLCFQAGDSIEADSYEVVALAGGQFFDTYGIVPLGEYTLTVADDNGERIALKNAASVVVDEVTYDDGPPWPVTPDGLGPSLELIDASLDNDDPRNWHASVHASEHTAGAANSVAQVGLPPWISNVQHNDPQPDIDPVLVTAEIQAATTVDFTYVIGAENPPTEMR